MNSEGENEKRERFSLWVDEDFFVGLFGLVF